MRRTNHLKIAILQMKKTVNQENRIKIEKKSKTDIIIEGINIFKAREGGGKSHMKGIRTKK